MNGTNKIQTSHIVLADSDESRRHFLRTAFAEIAGTVEVDDLVGIAGLTGSPPLVTIVGPLGEDVSAPVQALAVLRSLWPHSPLLVIGDPGGEDLAVAALRAGADDYLKAPVNRSMLMARVAAYIPCESKEDPEIPELVGSSASMREVKRFIQTLAPVDSTVLITGETGTGKELVAGALHKRSSRKVHNLVCINCAAIPDTLIESELFGFEKGSFTGAAGAHPGKLMLADSGTAFLDEVGDMSPLAQAKVLRALESGEIQAIGSKTTRHLDVRLIAATHQNLEALMEEKKFRMDLYFRLNVACIHIPPLRDRLEDIPELAAAFVREMSEKHRKEVDTLSPAALDLLSGHTWPGNVRQLRNVLEFATLVAPGSRITEKDLVHLHTAAPPDINQLVTARPPNPAAKLTPERLVEALQATNWNMNKAARLLQVSRTTIYRRLARCQIATRHGSESLLDPAKHFVQLDLPSSIKEA